MTLTSPTPHSWRSSVIGAWAAPIAVTGFVAGHSFLPTPWTHFGWLLLAGLAALPCTNWLPCFKRWQTDAGALSVLAFLFWMTLRSCIPAPAQHEMIPGLFGVALLVMFCALVWQQSHSKKALHVMGWVMGMTSALAALLSITLSYFVLPGHYTGERLTNLLVHGGLNPVCTGLIFGFAGVWLAASVENESSLLPRRITWAAIGLLHLATFLSGSRGAMLALACGHATLFLARGWRRGAAAACMFVITGMIYFTSAPLLAHITPSQSAPTVVTTAHPLQKALERGDNGRLDIYRAGWHAMDNLWLGTGQWDVCGIWQCELQARTDISLMSHLHSAFFATFVHGGIIGAVLLLVPLGIGIQRARRLAVQGDATWIALLAFGCGGLLFDGESLASLTTAPRFEGLLFWLPLTVALARGSATAPPAGS